MLAVVPEEMIDERRLGLDRRQVGVEELLYVDSTTKGFEVRRPEGEGWVLVESDGEGWTPLASLQAALRIVGGRLQVRTPLGIEEV